MSILPILTLPDATLRQKSLPVKMVDSEIQKLMDDMLETMYHDKGVGLAAIQVGVAKRVLVLDLQENDDKEREVGFYPLFIANPEVIEKSEETVIAKEGCLSLPEQEVEVQRHIALKLQYLDYNNNQNILQVDGWLARAIQHEMDHLDGKLLIDYLSKLKKDRALKKLEQIKKSCS
jgi:peptide deformylase